MPRGRWVILAVFFLGTLGIEGQAAKPLKLTQTIVAPGLKEGDFDHYAVELQSNRLFLTAEQNSAVEAFDLHTNKLVQAMSEAESAAFNSVPLRFEEAVYRLQGRCRNRIDTTLRFRTTGRTKRWLVSTRCSTRK